jgi:hypothetical protein
VKTAGRSRKDRAGFTRAIANSYDVVKLRGSHFIDGLRILFTDVNGCFGHNADRERIEPRWIDARARDFECIAAKLAKKALGHLTAAGIARAQKKHSLL